MTSPATAAPAGGGTPREDHDVVLRTIGLTKRYGKRLALSDLDIAVRRGRVYGFLGPNGSGKTTTIALALGLIAATEGHVELFGLDTRAHRSQALRRVGTTLEGQSYFPHLSARDNLRVWSKLDGTTAARIDEVIDRVGLASRARDKVRTYSLGMKQRLAVAAAIMHRPEMIILDEPTNGLDPAGIREFRELIRSLAAEGTTVFVSSHILAEVEQMCDDVAILKSGKLVAEGSVETLLLRHTTSSIALRTTDDARALELLRAMPSIAAARIEDGRIIVETEQIEAAAISRALAEQQIWLAELRPQESSLEDVFMEITGEGDAGA
jgi:ABC-2 type transport system ATP-binding protein